MCAILHVLLGINVSRNRAKTNILTGTGEVDGPLHRAFRAHANNAEYVPLAVLMLLIAEAGGAHSVSMHSLGGLLFVSRLASAHGILSAVSGTRYLGAVVTWLVTVGASAYALMLHFQIVSGS